MVNACQTNQLYMNIRRITKPLSATFTAFESVKSSESMKVYPALGIPVHKLFLLSKVVKVAESPLAESLKVGEKG